MDPRREPSSVVAEPNENHAFRLALDGRGRTPDPSTKLRVHGWTRAANRPRSWQDARSVNKTKYALAQTPALAGTTLSSANCSAQPTNQPPSSTTREPQQEHAMPRNVASTRKSTAIFSFADILPLCDFIAILLAAYASSIYCALTAASPVIAANYIVPSSLIHAWSDRGNMALIGASLATYLIYDQNFV